MATASGVRRIGERVERKDPWWIEPLIYVVVLGGFVIYSTWAALVNANYYADPYLSPFYSPCLAQNCVHPTLPLLGSWWNLSPAILIVGSPLAFRVTCYYYRRSYYRGFFRSPPACLVPDAPKRYSGETRFPFIIQNFHRYALYLAVLVLLVLWWDVIEAFNFGGRFGIGLSGRRLPRLVPQGVAPLPALELVQSAEPAAQPVGLGEPHRRGPDRPLHPARRDGRDRRPALDLLR